MQCSPTTCLRGRILGETLHGNAGTIVLDVTATRGARLRLRIAWATIGVLAICISTLPVYAWPPSDSAEGSDVVFVLGLATPQRLAVARQISDSNANAPIFVSDPALRQWVCSQARITCLSPHPSTTKGEAKLLRQIVQEHGFEKPSVVTFGPQVLRARYVFGRCYGGDVSVVRADDPLNAYQFARQVVYQSAATLKAILSSCDGVGESEPAAVRRSAMASLSGDNITPLHRFPTLRALIKPMIRPTEKYDESC